MLGEGIELAALKVEIKADIAGFKNQMEQAKVAGMSAANEMSASLSKAANVGTKLSSMGSTLTKAVTLPIAASGVAAVKMAMDYESSFAKVSTLLDDGRTDYNAYSKAILDGSTRMKTGVNDYSEAVYQSISAGVDQTKAIEFTDKAIKLAKGGFTSAAKSVDVLTTAINGYSLQTSDATKISDLLITTQNLGKTTVDELASSMGTVIPVAAGVNYNINELSTSYAVLTKNGIATAEAGTYLREMLSELGKTGSVSDQALRELAGKGFAELKKEGVPTTDILKMLSQYAEASGMTLKDMFGSVQAGSAAMVLAKQDGAEYNEILAAMEQSAGATQSAADKIDATKAERLSGAINSIKNSTIKLAEVATPLVEDIAGGIESLATKLDDLDENQQKLVVGCFGVVAAAGPLLSIAGKGVTLYTKLAPVIKGSATALSTFSSAAPAAAAAGETVAAGAATASTALGEAGVAAAATSETVATSAATASAALGEAGVAGSATAAAGGLSAVAPVAIVAAGGVIAVTAAAKSLGDYMATDVTDKGDIFNKYAADLATMGDSAQYASGQAGMASSQMLEFSDSTKEAVGAYISLDNEAQSAMLRLQFGQQTITGKIVADTTTKFSAMSDSITTKLDESYQQDLEALQLYFDSNSSMTAEQQAQMLADLQANHDTEVANVQGYRDQITQILQNASNEDRTLTADEVAAIGLLRQQMRDTAVQTMSATEQECTVIRQRLKDADGQITAEMASEAIKNANNARDQEVATADEKYNQIVTAAGRLREAGSITQEQYNQMVTDAASSKAAQIIIANEAADGVRQEIANGTPKIMSQVNAQTGEIASRWDSTVGNVKGTWDGFSLQEKTATVGLDDSGARIGWDTFVDWWNGLSWPSMNAVIGMGGSFSGGSPNYNGIDYVPYDGYRAVLHKGESVKTAEETKAMRQSSGPGGGREIKQEFYFYNSSDSPYEIGRIAEQAMRDMQFKGVL